MAIRKICAILPLFILSCSIFQTTSPAIVELLPRDTDVPGWGQQSPYYFTTPEKVSLFSGNYPLYHVSEIVLAQYQSISSSDVMIEVYILKSDTPLNAFGIYSLDRGFSQLRYARDNEYFTDSGLYFRNGEYYVKLLAQNSDDVRKNDLILFKDVITAKLGPVASKAALPQWMYTFSPSKSLADLVYYINGTPLIPELHDLFVRKRTIEGKDLYIFFMKGGTKYETSNLLLEIFKSSQPNFMLSKTGSVQVGLKENPEGGYLYIAYRNEWIYGVLNAESISMGNKIMITLYSEMGGM
jgi:hypothetical protein